MADLDETIKVLHRLAEYVVEISDRVEVIEDRLMTAKKPKTLNDVLERSIREIAMLEGDEDGDD